MKTIRDIDIEAPIQRIMPCPDGRVAVQDEATVSLVDLETAARRPIIPRRAGHELIAVLAPRTIVVFQEAEGVTGLSEEGRRAGRADLGPDAEFVEARTLADRKSALVLIGEMIGDPLALGVPRFRFVVVRDDLSLISIRADWPRCPRVWTIDERARRILVQDDPDSMALAEFEIANGKPTGRSRWGPKRPADMLLTALDVSPKDGSGVGGYAVDESQLAQLAIVRERDAEPAVLASMEDGGIIEAVRLSPDGERILFRYGLANGEKWFAAEVKRLARGGGPTPIPDADPEADAVWVGPGRLAVVVGESKLRIIGLD